MAYSYITSWAGVPYRQIRSICWQLNLDLGFGVVNNTNIPYPDFVNKTSPQRHDTVLYCTVQ